MTVSALVHAPMEKVWQYWTEPSFITQWNAASPDWHCPWAKNDLRVGGTFSARMEAKDGSEGFEFQGTYTEVIPMRSIRYAMEDGRRVVVTFEAVEEGILVTESFDPEHENSEDMQREGWQAILNHFKALVEKSSA